MVEIRSFPDVTVVVCAYTLDRWNDLVEAVRSVRDQNSGPADVEILVVIDHNEALLARMAEISAELGVRVLANTATRGLSGARNTAVAAAKGEIVVFLDDDARARPEWLAALLRPYATPGVVAVGGVAVPQWPNRRPVLFPAQGENGLAGDVGARGELDWIVGCTYRGSPVDRSEVRNLMGCNMSFRRSVFERVGGFAEEIGRIGNNPLGCEETELCIRIRQSYRSCGDEVRIVFEPAAIVDHRVTADRTRWSYLRRRSWAEGLSKAAVARLVGRDSALATERGYVAEVLPAAVSRELRMGRWASATAIVTALVWTAAGFVRGMVPGAMTGVVWGPEKSAPRTSGPR